VSLPPEDLSHVLRELALRLVGARVKNVLAAGDEAIVVVFRARRERIRVLVSARRGAFRIHRIAEPPSPEGDASQSFAMAARAELRGAELRAILESEDHRAIELRFESQASDPDLRASESSRARAASIVLDLTGPLPDLVLLDDERIVRSTLRAGRRDRRAPRHGERYEVAIGQPVAVDSAGAISEEGFPVSEELESRYREIERALEIDARRTRLLRDLRREIERRRKNLEKLSADERRASEGLEAGELGELLKASWNELRRGMSSIEVVDWRSPSAEKIRIGLDPALSPHENVERLFQRARKSRRAIPILEERRARLEEELDELERRRTDLEGESVELPALDAAEATIERLGRRRMSQTRSARRPAASMGPRRFLSSDGLEILVGRSASQNDELTTRIARGNDIFLHVSGRPGAHVIVRATPGREVPPASLHEAAQLALYYSLVERSSGALDSGVRGDVDWTPVKHVVKPKGAKPGAVLLRTHKTLRVELDAETIRAIRERSSAAG